MPKIRRSYVSNIFQTFYNHRYRRDLPGASEYDENITHEYNENESKGNVNLVSLISASMIIISYLAIPMLQDDTP